MKTLESNKELYEFLRALREDLTARGLKEQAEILARAVASSAAMSTEFVGESRVALSKLLREAKGLLSPQERADVEAVIQQIDDASDRRR